MCVKECDYVCVRVRDCVRVSDCMHVSACACVCVCVCVCVKGGVEDALMIDWLRLIHIFTHCNFSCDLLISGFMAGCANEFYKCAPDLVLLLQQQNCTTMPLLLLQNCTTMLLPGTTTTTKLYYYATTTTTKLYYYATTTATWDIPWRNKTSVISWKLLCGDKIVYNADK